MTRPKRSLSQNFLVDHNIRRKLVETLGAGPEDVVLEVGPGHGELSELLVGRVRQLLLVEKDDRLAPELRRRWDGRDDVRVVHGDALEVDLSALLVTALDAGATGPRLISNLPYAITSPLLFRLLDVAPPAERIVVLVQEEVARRITSDPGCKEYGALTVGVRTQARAEFAFTVSRNAFRPVPGVDSAALVLEPVDGPEGERRERLRDLVRAAFSRRRKQLRTILRSAPAYGLGAEAAEGILAGLGIDPRARPETLSPDQFVALADRLEAHPRVG
ncbi:MAG: 16S rRNA (adenine(1518)-N(6)/adenine(1519)-N(6))-dimethyltransferase RsmA [Gemmatimonadales bacterium]